MLCVPAGCATVCAAAAGSCLHPAGCKRPGGVAYSARSLGSSSSSKRRPSSMCAAGVLCCHSIEKPTVAVGWLLQWMLLPGCTASRAAALCRNQQGCQAARGIVSADILLISPPCMCNLFTRGESSLVFWCFKHSCMVLSYICLC